MWQDETTIHPYRLHLHDEPRSNFSASILDPVIYSLLSYKEYSESLFFQKPQLPNPANYALISCYSPC